jgi:hypothetical protein
VFVPSQEPSPVTRRVRWSVTAETGGTRTLLFTAKDHGASPLVGTRTVVVRVEGAIEGSGPAASAVGALVGDVTGDGIQDVVASAGFADSPMFVDVGTVYVFAGGAAPSAGPHATLRSPQAAAGDFLSGGAPPGIQLADVTGDGVLDVVVSAPSASLFGVQNSGGVFVFKGGPLLLGAVVPTAILAPSNPTINDQLGLCGGQACARRRVERRRARPGRRRHVRGPEQHGKRPRLARRGVLVGAVAATASSRSRCAANDQLGDVSGQGIQVADVTGDGRCSTSWSARAGATFRPSTRGRFVWAAGPGLSGAPTPTAILADANAAGGQLCGATIDGFLLEDVTGDGSATCHRGAPAGGRGDRRHGGRLRLGRRRRLTGNVAPARCSLPVRGARGRARRAAPRRASRWPT